MATHSSVFSVQRASQAARNCRAILWLPAALASLVLVGTLAAQAAAFETKVPYAVLLDASTGAVLFEKRADAAVAPNRPRKSSPPRSFFARSRKAGSAFHPDDDLGPGGAGGRREVGRLEHARAGGPADYVDDLLRGLLVLSGNDAAIALAEGIAGSEGAFAARMNEEARAVGMRHSHFVNAWGNGNAGQKVTPRDMAHLAAYVIGTYPQFYHYFGETAFTWNGVRQENRNPLLSMNIGADGLKTGHLAASGYGLVGSAVQGGRRLIAVLYGARTEAERANEGRRLLEFGFHGAAR